MIIFEVMKGIECCRIVMLHRWRCTECGGTGSYVYGELAADSVKRTGEAHGKRHEAKGQERRAAL